VPKKLSPKKNEGEIREMNGEFKYTEEDLSDPSFIAIVCGLCDIEIGYDPCPNCETED
jgi:hypothetical protein